MVGYFFFVSKSIMSSASLHTWAEAQNAVVKGHSTLSTMPHAFASSAVMISSLFRIVFFLLVVTLFVDAHDNDKCSRATFLHGKEYFSDFLALLPLMRFSPRVPRADTFGSDGAASAATLAHGQRIHDGHQLIVHEAPHIQLLRFFRRHFFSTISCACM